MIALFVANCLKLQVCKIIRETIQNANFEQRGPTPYTEVLVLFFGLKWFLMGQILTCLVSLGFLVEKWPFCSTLLYSTVNHGGVQNVIRKITPPNLALHNP